MSGADSKLPSIAFLGTGLMGAPMAGRLLAAGYPVTVWNRSRDKATPLVAAGAAEAESPAAAVRNAEVICLCLTDATAVEQVLFGADGISSAGRSRQLLIDFSTIGPLATGQLAQKLRAKCGVHWVDAPVSGGVPGAQEGKLVIFCGGDVDDVARAEPLFNVLAKRITHLGNVGSGQTAKLCNQIIVATNLLAIAEALSFARACGLDITRLPDAWTGGFADSLPLQIFGRRMATGATSPKLGELSLMLKDVEAFVAAADLQGSANPLAQRAAQLYAQAAGLGLRHEDLGTLIRLYDSKPVSVTQSHRQPE